MDILNASLLLPLVSATVVELSTPVILESLFLQATRLIKPIKINFFILNCLLGKSNTNSVPTAITFANFNTIVHADWFTKCDI